MPRKTRKLDGLYKRCACPQARWKRCHIDEHPWYHHYKPKGGTLVREVLGVMTQGEAEERQEERRKALRDQAATGTQSDGRMSLDELAKMFAVGRPRDSYLDILCRQEVGGARLGSKRVKDITVQHLLDAMESYKRTMTKKGDADGRVGVRKFLQAGRHLWNWAIDTKKTNSSPFYSNGRPVVALAQHIKPSPGRDRRLQGDEEARLLKHADPFTLDMIVGMLDTGLRADSLRKLTWDDVQETHIVVPPHKQKWGLKKKVQTTMRIPILSERLREVLERRRLGPDGQRLPADAHVFGTATGEKIRREFWGDLFRATRERAGIPSKGRNRLNAHDLRGEFGSQLSDLGIPMKDISLALGHSTSAATEAYLRPRVAHLDDAHQRLQDQRSGKILNFTNRFTRKTRKAKKTA